MWCCNLTKRHGLLLFIIYIIGLTDTLSSSASDCKCKGTVPNSKCSKQTNCSVVCNDGYWGQKCQFGRIRLTNPRGYITDGSENETYQNLSKLMWLIDVEKRVNASIHFQIEFFITECNWDHLYIFDGDSTEAPLLAAFNGHLVEKIPQEIIANSGSAFIYFYSDLSEVQLGFNILYSMIDKCPCINGRCNTAGLCICNQGWTGGVCDVQKNCSCINGVCNQTLGKCVCDDGFTGFNCSQPVTSSYWTSVRNYSGIDVPPRGSHTAAIIGDNMWIFNGYRFSHPKDTTYRKLHRYNLKDKIWTSFPLPEGDFIWGHSMVAYQDKLVIFGGEGKDQKIQDRVVEFNTSSSKWRQRFGFNPSPIGVTGHTATIVGDKMIVIFGLNENGLFPGVQEYDIEKSKWEVIKSSSSAFGVARYGHSSVYDPISARIFVYAGIKATSGPATFSSSDDLLAYYPQSRKWITLESSKFPQTLHSAVIVDHMMLVFGGNSYVPNDNNSKCHSTKLHVYDLACQKWHSEGLPQVAKSFARYGHSAVAKERAMYIFGGFNGVFFNDILTYTHGDCERIVNESQCMEKYFSSGCYWNNSQCVNKESLKTLPQCPGEHVKLCSDIKFCDECKLSPNCGWLNKSCQVNGNEVCPKMSPDICPLFSDCKSCKNAGCYWKSSKCQAQFTTGACRSCAESTSQKECLGSHSCLWCENLRRCIDNRLYLVHYPYAQCFEWTSSSIKGTHKDTSCADKLTCRDCLTLPSCGWQESAVRDGSGQCLKGSAQGPKDSWNSKNWHFFDCPLCQCNGHSNCSVNSSVCLRCRDHTTGANCDKCVDGYFGTPHNSGKCYPCECNGHADTCTADTGKCSCRMRGVDGDHCEKCISQYVGNATDGGYCFYKLTPDYLYKINVSDKLIFNFICSPNESDEDTVVTVNIIKGSQVNPAMLNISVGSDTMDEVFLLTNIELSSEYEEKFSKDHFSFGSDNFHFKIYVYNLTPYSTVAVSVHQPNDNGINLLKFFIVFLACFIGLLIIAVAFWKAKSFFDTFRRTRRRNVEMIYMTNRPFASIPICMDKPGHLPMKTKPSPLTSEICYGSKAAVVTVLVRLPVCAQTENSPGAASLCLGSALVNYNEHQGSKVMNYMKNIKRRRNPFRSSSA